MGEAKRRGTRAERVQQALARQEAQEAPERVLEGEVLTGGVRPRRKVGPKGSMAMAMMCALAASTLVGVKGRK